MVGGGGSCCSCSCPPRGRRAAGAAWGVVVVVVGGGGCWNCRGCSCPPQGSWAGGADRGEVVVEGSGCYCCCCWSWVLSACSAPIVDNLASWGGTWVPQTFSSWRLGLPQIGISMHHKPGCCVGRRGGAGDPNARRELAMRASGPLSGVMVLWWRVSAEW